MDVHFYNQSFTTFNLIDCLIDFICLIAPFTEEYVTMNILFT